MSPPTVARGAWLWPHPRGVYDHCRGIAPFVVYGPPPPPAGVRSPGQDIGVGAAKFNFRKYPVLFPTFISSLRLKFTTRLPYSLRTQNPHSVQKSSFYGKINYTGSCFY